jgi:thermitase
LPVPLDRLIRQAQIDPSRSQLPGSREAIPPKESDMPSKADKPNDVLVPRPECDPGPLHEGCDGPPPTPWLSWKHCFKIFEFREYVIRLDQNAAVAREGIRIRVRFEHALCPMGRKQGPIVHSLSLLPQEEVKIYESDRYRQATSTSARFSQRSSFYSYVSRVNESLASVKSDFGTAFSSTASVAASGGGGLDLGIVSFGGEAASSSSVSVANHLDVDSVFESFRHVAEISSQAVETERSIVVSTFTENVSVDTTFRTLRNVNHCRAVTYFIRRVFEVYCLSTRLVGIEVQIGGNWIDIKAVPDAVREAILKQLGPIVVGQVSQRSSEVAIPTDGLLFEAELAHCSSCEPEMEKRLRLELRKLEVEVDLLERENERRKQRIASGDLSEFDPCCPEVEDAES